MPRKKRNTAAVKTTADNKAVAETAPVEAAVVETAPVAEAAPAEAAPVVEETPKKRGRKAATKKAEPVKTEAAPVVEEAPKKRSRKPAENKAAEENVVIQFMGAAVTASELIAKAKADCGAASPKTVDVYVKPEENMVYYVVDGVTGAFALV